METTRPSLLVRVKDPQDDAAWEEFRRTYLPVLERFAEHRSRALGLSRVDPEECAVDALGQLWRRLPDFDLDQNLGRFRTYLYRLVSNLLVDRGRKQRHEVSTELDDWEHVPAPAVDSDLDRAFDRALIAGALRRVAAMVQPGNPVRWECFLRHWLDGQGAARVAQDVGISVASVYQNVSRVLRLVRRELEAEGARELG